jgi:hypothetical protein
MGSFIGYITTVFPLQRLYTVERNINTFLNDQKIRILKEAVVGKQEQLQTGKPIRM